MPLKIVRGRAAVEALKDQGFRAQWVRLYRECPWATAAQSPAFTTCWYEAYKERYSLLLVCEFSASNELIGFLPLALSPSGRAVFPGAHQAEYKGWLALPSNGGSFFEASLKALSGQTQIGALSFRYLPRGVPIEGIGAASRSRWICELGTHKRPIVRLASAADVAEYIRQKTNKTIRYKYNRLKRIGNVRLERIRECEQLAPIFDRLIEWYEMRQEAAHGKRPFQTDKNKKPWHLCLLQEGLLHVTLLKAGQEVVSALFGLSDGKTYSSMMPMFAPEYAHYSPIALHHLLLVQQLHTEGYSVLDLTPGLDPFKENFASEYEDVHVLSVYFKHSQWIKAKFRQRSEAIAKGILSVIGIEPSSLARTLPRIQAFLRLRRPPSGQSPHMPEPV
jgi:CelD/BcsL family acetyltransferase involved in cellulose biosynthesis